MIFWINCLCALCFLSQYPRPASMYADHQADGIELRLDLFTTIDIEQIGDFLKRSVRPVMLTVRKASHGGKFSGSEEEREALIIRLLDLGPHFFDLEYDMRPEFILEVLTKYPQTQFVLSYHNFKHTPRDLDAVYHLMTKYSGVSYKIAAMALSANDALRMLLFGKRHPQVSSIAMGEPGRFARVLGPVMGNIIDFASLDQEEQSAPGQLAISELVDVYHYPDLNRETAIFGLIGNPVINSPGHLYHNAVFRSRNLNAVYVKMAVGPEELSDFIPLAKQMGIRGLSVTSPLKEKIVPFLDRIDPRAEKIGAINTLLFKEGQILGTNTDGFGALDAIEKKISVNGKKVVLLGAGGAARAIAFEARARGAELMILNRTIERAEELAGVLGCGAGRLGEMPPDYDILINCSSDPMPIDAKKMRSKVLAMDIMCFPKETAFLKEAQMRECQIVYGEEMYVNQAAGQTRFWMDA